MMMTTIMIMMMKVKILAEKKTKKFFSLYFPEKNFSDFFIFFTRFLSKQENDGFILMGTPRHAAENDYDDREN